MILRASARLWNQPGDENPNNGFRCAQNLDRKASVFRKPEPERSRPLRACVLHVRIMLQTPRLVPRRRTQKRPRALW